MKASERNLKKLKALGFTPDYPEDVTYWWSLPCGWGFILEMMPNFRTLKNRLRISVEKEGETWSKEMKRAYRML